LIGSKYIAIIDWYTREVLGSQISLKGKAGKLLKKLNKTLNE